MVRTRGLITWLGPLCVVLLTPALAGGTEQLSLGLSLGGFQVGTFPQLAVSPHAGVSWRIWSDFIFTIHDLCSLLPPVNDAGIGVFNETSIAIGHTSKTVITSIGPSISIYYLLTCGATLCGRVAGVAPGGHAHTEIYLTESLGFSMSANIDWIGGSSLVLLRGMALMVVAGPVLRWRAK